MRKEAHSKAPPSRRYVWQKDGGSSMEVVSSGVAVEVASRKVFAPSRASASSRRWLPGKEKFPNPFEPHHSDPMILITELFRLAGTLDPTIRKFRRPKSEGRMSIGDEASSACSLARVNCFGVRSSGFFRVSEIRISDFGFNRGAAQLSKSTHRRTRCGFSQRENRYLAVHCATGKLHGADAPSRAHLALLPKSRRDATRIAVGVSPRYSSRTRFDPAGVTPFRIAPP